MNEKADIVKYVAVIIRNNKYLIVKDAKDEFWKNVGGKPMVDESPEDCLKREVQEELSVDVIGLPEYYYTCPITPSASDPQKTVKMILYLVKIAGEPTPQNEIQEIHWLSKQEFVGKDFIITQQMEDFILPKLIEDGMVK